MAKITQVITRPSQEYDYTVAEAQTRDLDGIVQKLNTTDTSRHRLQNLLALL